jgi:hypothetical protein
MEEFEILASGEGEFPLPDPDAAREWIGQRKAKGLVNKVMTEQEAVARFVSDGDYVSWDLADVVRGPLSLFREIMPEKEESVDRASLQLSHCKLALCWGMCGKGGYRVHLYEPVHKERD